MSAVFVVVFTLLPIIGLLDYGVMVSIPIWLFNIFQTLRLGLRQRRYEIAVLEEEMQQRRGRRLEL